MSGPKIFISAGEPSGDLHASNFLAAVRRQSPDATFFGLGGPLMAAQGCRLIRDMTTHGSHMLVVEPLLQLGHYLKLIAEVDRQLQYERPDVMVFVDYPGLNFVLASRGRYRRIPTMWYVPPQLWAWASFRVHKMARRLTRVACIFPFTVEFYRSHGIDAHFVGHPLIDHFAGFRPDPAVAERLRGPDGQKIVLLLPGSRKSEIAGLLPLYLNVCRLMQKRVEGMRIVMGCLNQAHADQAAPILRQAPDVPVETFVGKTNELMALADFALASSGTATLELACFGTPMIALYPVSRWQYQLFGRWLLTTPFLSLPNAVAQRKIIPEYFLYWGGPEPIADDAVDILTNPDRNRQMRQDLAEVHRKLGQGGASDGAARLALELVGREIPPVPWWRFGLNV
jgi:lipid-A-disaccharide synthase